ncbi:TetR/AcrR family transcriptional regulator [Iamia majanohamensis]|uniref:TetR/AcrR family transcriptional regulator n=1 Tax=Iamia majanohamensis TaxID=467976 RepID=A0AAE9Y4H8_9ACTN|nr:TetR/AcrR family transcriptional regulator [Iamia majanohamensis]WCO66117.1 TetR/AcrR family transcriptional regulator [Iamia majanohamensis]
MSTRRAEIVDVAKDLFAARGYAATSMRDIALASDLLAGSLYSHFRSKAHILELVLLPFFDQLIPGQRAALEAGSTGAEEVEDMLRRVLAVCAAHDAELTILHYDWAHLAEIDELAEVVARSSETLELWEQALARGQADGSLRSEVGIPTAVRIITSSIHGVLDRRRFGTLADDAPRDVDALADEVVASLVSGLRTTPARV